MPMISSETAFAVGRSKCGRKHEAELSRSSLVDRASGVRTIRPSNWVM